MILVIASCYDETAKAMVVRWKAHGACLLTCEDLSVAGWRYYPAAFKSSTAVVAGQEVALKEIKGILTRLPGIPEQELLWIVPADRRYVAMEMTSFLTSWLFEAKCPVLNRPTPMNLSGPNWRPERWTYAASQLGIPVRPAHRYIALSSPVEPDDPASNAATVTVIGDRCFGSVDEALNVQARLLANAANVDLLAVHFSGSEVGSLFLGANLWPDVTGDDMADAVIEYFQRRPVK